MYCIDVPWFILEAEKRKLEMLISSHLYTGCYQYFLLLNTHLCIFFYIFLSFFTAASVKRWSKPAGLASFSVLYCCKEEMLAEFVLMLSREARADSYPRECGQNSRWWWLILQWLMLSGQHAESDMTKDNPESKQLFTSNCKQGRKWLGFTVIMRLKFNY